MATNKRKEAAALFELIDKSTLKVPKNAGALKIPSWWSSKSNPPTDSAPPHPAAPASPPATTAAGSQAAMSAPRNGHANGHSLAGGAGLLAAFLLGPGLPGLIMLVIGGACTGCTVAAFWAIPTRLLPPRALAMGIVMINMLGSFAGATVPPAMGFLKERSGSFLPPTLLLFGIAVLCALLCLVARAPMRRTSAAA